MATVEPHPTEPASAQADHDRAIVALAALTDPAKLDTLSERAATPRLRKACYWLHEAGDPAHALEQALVQNGSGGTARGEETATALIRNLDILFKLGCLDDAGLEKMRHGRAPTITQGPYAGELAEVDHIVPKSVCPEFDNKLFNLEFMPRTLTRRKSDEVGQRQVQQNPQASSELKG
jgi:hypothetical protein